MVLFFPHFYRFSRSVFFSIAHFARLCLANETAPPSLRSIAAFRNSASVMPAFFAASRKEIMPSLTSSVNVSHRPLFFPLLTALLTALLNAFAPCDFQRRIEIPFHARHVVHLRLSPSHLFYRFRDKRTKETKEAAARMFTHSPWPLPVCHAAYRWQDLLWGIENRRCSWGTFPSALLIIHQIIKMSIGQYFLRAYFSDSRACRCRWLPCGRWGGSCRRSSRRRR